MQELYHENLDMSTQGRDTQMEKRLKRLLARFGTLPGAGMVAASKGLGDDEEVTVASEGRGDKRLLASYAKMEKG